MEASGPELARRGRNLMVAGRKTAGQRRADLVADVALAVGMAGLMLGTMQAARAADAAGIQLAQAGQSFDIPAQPLAGAITSFGRQSGLQVTVEAAIANDLQSPGVSGSYTPDEALGRLLAGTGVSYRFIDANTVTLVRGTAADGAVVLDPLQIDANRRAESPWGPVAGFVATRGATATKTDTPLLETPQSISVVTRDQMDAQAAQTMPHALRYTAGMQTDRNGGDERADFLYSRGMEVGQYLDGLRLIGGTWSVPQIDSYGLERVEVVKGPASVLYGQVAPGGLANMVSKRPTDSAYHEIQFQSGNYGRLQAAFDLSGPVDEDRTVLFRLSGLGRHADTQVDQSKEERVAINPAVTWNISDDTTLTVLGKYQYDPALGAYHRLPAHGTVLHNEAGQIPTDLFLGDPSFDKQDRTEYSLGYEFSHRIDDVWSLQQNFRFMRVDGEFGYLYSTRPRGVIDDTSLIRRGSVLVDEVNDAFTVDNQVHAKFNTGTTRHHVIAGLDYQNNRNDRVDDYGSATDIDFNNPVYGNPGIDFTSFPFQISVSQRMTQTGVYVQDQVAVDRWRFTFGGRYDWLENDATDRVGNRDMTSQDEEFTTRLGALYLFDNGLAPYVSYSESFNGVPGANENSEIYKPTTGQQYEVGVKFQPTGYNSFVSLAAYQLTQQNVASTRTDPLTGASFTYQTGEVESEGIDLEAKAALTDSLSLIATYSYVNANISASENGTTGRTPVYTPRHAGTLWADYSFLGGYLEGLGLGTGIRMSGKTFGDNTVDLATGRDKTFLVPGYAVFDAAVRYDLGALSPDLAGARLAVNATNLFDKIYVADCQNDTNCYYGSRRKVYATLSYQW